MAISIEQFLLICSTLLLISVLAGRTSHKYGVPTLLLFIAIGMLAGSEGFGHLAFNNFRLAQSIGIISLNFILFSGGLDTDWKAIKPIVKRGITLSTLGVFLTMAILGTFVWLISDFTILESLLLGSIVSSTDAAAVFSILRSKNIALKNNLRPTLELESGSNDPMAYVLMITFLGLVVNQDQSLMTLIPMFFFQMILGAVIGIIFGYFSKWFINNIKLGYESLYPALVIALMLLAYSITEILHGNGFLAVYLSAVFLGNQYFIHKRTVLKAFDGFAWLMQILLFLTLGLLVSPSEIIKVMGIGMLISLFLILVARPASVFMSLAFFKFPIKEKLFLSWVGLRGAVPIVFATFPLLMGIDKAYYIFNIVFFISVTSVLIQGTTLSTIAKWLKVNLPAEQKTKHALDEFMDEPKNALLEEVLVLPHHRISGKKIIDLHFPTHAIIAMIQRDGQYLTPNGATKIEINDKLFILASSEQGMEEVRVCFTENSKKAASTPAVKSDV